MCTKHERAMKTPLSKVTFGDYIFRPGKQRDAAKIQAWMQAWKSNDPSVGGALKAAAEHVQAEDGAGFVVVDSTGPVGVFTVEVPHLQFAFFIDQVRGKGVATSAAAALIEHYFGTSSEPWIGDSGSRTTDGEGLVVRLGFEKDEWQNFQLTRSQWNKVRSKFVRRAE